MKKILTLLLAVVAFGSMNAQRITQPKQGIKHPMMHSFGKPVGTTGFENALNAHEIGIPPSETQIRNTEVEIGITNYDLQANASDNNRLLNLGNGNLRACFNISPDIGTLTWPGRGSGYNVASSGLFGPSVTARLEGVRTGFPTMVHLDNGTDVVFAHTPNAATSGFQIHQSSKAASATTWTETNVPSATPKGFLWARAVSSGNTIHLIAITEPVGNGGVAVNNVDGQLMYFRSKDGGANWDVKDFIIPGTDAGFALTNDGEGYSIDVEGDVVAVGMASLCNDVALFKSTDGGDTWAKTIVYNFPIDFYEIDQGYTVDQIDTALTGGLDPLAMITSDGHISVKVDALGKVHVSYGAFWIKDDDGATTAGFNWWPSSLGVIYWNEDMGEDTAPQDGILPGSDLPNDIDINGDGTWNVDLAGSEYNDYGITATQSQSSMGFGSDGSLIITTSTVDERYHYFDNNQVFRHVLLFRLKPGATTFDGPFDVTAAAAADISLIEAIESAFPYVSKDCSDKVHVMWQFDFKPGSDVTDATAANLIQPSSIYYANFDLAEIQNTVTSTKNVLNAQQLDIALTPNPASEMMQIDLTLAQKADKVNLAIFDMSGQLVREENRSNVQNDRFFLDVKSMPNGVYSLTVRTENGLASRKFTVLH